MTARLIDGNTANRAPIEHLDGYVPRRARSTATEAVVRERLLALKTGQPCALDHYARELDLRLRADDAIVCIPSHGQGRMPSAIRTLAQAAAARYARVDLTGALVRTQTIRALHQHGDRSPLVQRDSLALDAARLAGMNGRRVVLLDDVATTGTSLATARDLLVRAGTREVVALALAQTQRRP